MSRIRSRDTGPEETIRGLLRELGFRYRRNDKKLCGSPDFVLPKYRTVIFVHGCFWHSHHCRRSKRPSSNAEFWNQKLDKNIRRDRRVKRTLWADGWHVLTIWQCQLKHLDRIRRKLQRIEDYAEQGQEV